jgi:Zn-dependent protease with chaperone function
MKIQELKHNRALMTVLQGLLLLVILATLLSVCISLLATGVRADLNALNEKLADQQAVATEGNDQQTIDSLEELKKSMDPKKYVGRAPYQVDKYLREVVQPILDAHKDELGMHAEINV